MIYQDFNNRRVYLDEYYVDGIQVVTAYTLYNNKSRAEYLLGSMTDTQYWVVEDIYRFYCLNNKIIKEKTYEVYYEPKKSHDDLFNIKTIKTFVKYLQKQERSFIKDEELLVDFKHFRTDWYCPETGKLEYRTIETGSERDNNYQKFEWHNNTKRFLSFGNEYMGEMADTKEIDDILEIIKSVNQTIKKDKQKCLTKK